MIESPIVRPQTITSLEQDFGTSICTSIWLKLINNHAWVDKNIPVGFLLSLFRDIQPVSDPALSDPNPDIWQFCDGTVINDSDSPLDGQAVPDMRNLFLKGASGVQFSTGGQSSIDLTHTHVIGINDNRTGLNRVDNNNDRQSGGPHDHPLSNDWGVFPVLPLYAQYHAYVRYK